MLETIVQVATIAAVPALSLILSIGLLAYKLFTIKYDIYLERTTIVRFIIVWILIFTTLFGILLFLTGGVNKFFFVENSFAITYDTVQYGFGGKYLVLVPTFQFFNFMVISMLTGLVYSTMLTLPKICTRIPVETETIESKSSKVEAGISTASAATSALAGVSVCCTTSIVSLLIPAVASVLAPVTPILLVISQFMLVYTTHKTVFPRFGVKFF